MTNHDLMRCSVPYCPECKETCLTKTLLLNQIIDLQTRLEELEYKFKKHTHHTHIEYDGEWEE